MDIRNVAAAIASHYEQENEQMELRGHDSKSHEGELARINEYEIGQFYPLIMCNLYESNEEIRKDLIETYKHIGDHYVARVAEETEKCLADPNLLTADEPLSPKIGGTVGTVCVEDGKIKRLSFESSTEPLDVVMNVFYVPSTKLEEPERIRIAFELQMSSKTDYPYMRTIIDFGEDGSVVLSKPVVIFEDETKLPYSGPELGFDGNGINAIKEVVTTLFADVKKYEKSHKIG